MQPSRTARIALASLALGGSLATPATNPAAPAIRADGEVQIAAARLAWRLDGPFAVREIELVLHNPHDRALETTVLLPLAANERLHGYALDIDGQLRQAVPVERVQARAAFEDTVRGRVDPALAQQETGNRYSIRVFPVPAHGERRLRVDVASLATRAACGWQHHLAPALPAGSALQAQVTASTRPHQAQALHFTGANDSYGANWAVRGVTDSRDVCLPAPAGDAAFSATFADGLQMHWLEVPVTPTAQPLPALPPPARIEVVWDASFSMLGVDRTQELQLLASHLAGRTLDVTVSVLRETIERRQVHLANQAQLNQLIASLQAETADGATALADWRADPAAKQILLFSDAHATLPGVVTTPASAPVFVIGRTLADAAQARWLARGGGQVLDLSLLTPAQALRALRQPPALQARPGPLDGHWHLERSTVASGALHACHVANQPGAIPALAIAHATPSGIRVQSHKAKAAHSARMAAFWCATWQAEDLEAQPERNRAALAMLGERFGVANRETSLLVLESDDDYVRNGILPPEADAALRARVLQQRQQAEARKAVAWAENREAIRRGWEARTAWWNQPFPKDDPRPRWAEERAREAARREQEQHEQARQQSRRVSVAAAMMEAGAPPPAPAPAPAAAADMASPEPEAASPAIAMQLQAVMMDSPYVAELRTAPSAEVAYQRYLGLRTQYGQSPAFHFDVAQRLFELGDARRGWRVLGNIVELLPRDQASLRLVAYRLQDAGLQAQAVALLRQLPLLAPDEPQSFRDLALALQAPATCGEAMTLLEHVVETPWSPRFADIGLIALAERNDLRTRCPGAGTGNLPDALQTPLPVGLRVVLRWDLNDTDIDLHVTDPHGEEVYYAHRNSYQGGAISRDFTAGYGPEEFILRTPKPGKYQVSVRYYGSRLARLARGATVNVALQTGFGSPALQQQTISLRLLEQSGNVAVGSFTVQPGGTLVAAPIATGKDAP